MDHDTKIQHCIFIKMFLIDDFDIQVEDINLYLKNSS
jgi:hypothetical protein